MTARRLLIVMLVLLGVSTLAAALVPQDSLRDETDGTQTATETTGTPTEAGGGPPGRAVAARIFVGGEKVPVIPLAIGDQLSLTVCSRETVDLIEIPLIGRVEPIRPGVPTYFNLLPGEKGSYAIRFVEADRVAARIEVGPRRSGAPGAPAGAPKSGCPAPAPR